MSPPKGDLILSARDEKESATKIESIFPKDDNKSSPTNWNESIPSIPYVTTLKSHSPESENVKQFHIRRSRYHDPDETYIPCALEELPPKELDKLAVKKSYILFNFILVAPQFFIHACIHLFIHLGENVLIKFQVLFVL